MQKFRGKKISQNRNLLTIEYGIYKILKCELTNVT